ncbi:MAG: type II secretion system F family protein [Candidatus Altiarchaeota archaeon]
MERVYYTAAKLLPKYVRERATMLLRYCGSEISAEVWFGRSFVVSVAIFLISSVVFYFVVENFLDSVILILIALAIYHLAAYLLLYFKAESRGRAVERVLSNFLHLIAANLNSGMTPFQSFKEASRPEFGILKDEVDRTIALSMSTMSFHKALLEMPTRIKSVLFQDVIELLVEGMKTGGPLAVLLTDIAKDITENLDMRREIVTSSRSYILFITFIVIIGTPLLSAVSIHFIRTISGIMGQVMFEFPDIQYVGGIELGELTLTPEFLLDMTMFNITCTTIIASWLLAVIGEGKDKYMVKYLLFMMPSTFAMFYSFDYLINLIL